MKPTYLFILLLASAAWAPSATAQPGNASSTFLEEQSSAGDQQREEEEEAYSSAQDALSEGQYDDAINGFDSVIKMHGRKADAATYWKAYALNKAGNKTQALNTLAELRKSYPKSTWLHDAGILETEMRGVAVNPEKVADEEEKVMALNALMNSDSEKAIPLLEKIIQGSYSPRLKEKALFVLSQSGSEKAQQILLSVAKANNNPDLQKRAIRNIGMNSSNRNRAALKEIYNGTSDISVKKMVFQGWLMSGDKEDVLAVARTEKSAELRKEAVRYLGMMGGNTELVEMYKSSADPATRTFVVEAMLMCGCSHELSEIVLTEKDPGVLEKAINTLGLIGGAESLATLTKVYNSQADISVKKKVINALFLHGAAKEMVALARKETNPELKKALISKMSIMGSPEINEYMMEILNK
jgi:tetratricopeptide (TPR) repeat protein